MSRREYLDRAGTLIVVRPSNGSEEVELFLVLADDGSITAFNGHIDMGTGVRTALGQIVAEELDVPFERVTMVLGDTENGPNQGPTIASETIQVAAVPLRQAAAQARHFMIELAAQRLQKSIPDLRTRDGWVWADSGDSQRVSFESLLAGRTDRLVLGAASVKSVADYRVVGQSVQRVDIAGKATAQAVYVHDVRLPGMLHGRVVRPPYAGLDSGDFIGTSLLSVDESSLAAIDGIVAVVVIRDFIGIVAQREEQAAAAARSLRVTWKPGPVTPDLQDLRHALSAQPSRPRTLAENGEVDRRIAQAQQRMQRTYIWPYQLHASIGPSCAVADWREDGLKIWSGTQNPHTLRAEIALLMHLPEAQVEIVRLEASGCYGRNCADDVAADAALLSRAVARPVRVQLTREQENLWEPKGAAQIMQVDGGLASDGSIAAYDFSTRYPSNWAPTLALLLTGAVPATPTASDMGDRTAIPPYRLEHMRIVVHDMAPIVRASWLRGVSALPNSFAHECYMDELAAAAGTDPIEFRLDRLEDQRARDLIDAVAQRAGWRTRTEARREDLGAQRRRGQGFAYARYVHGKFPGTAAAWSAWVAEVEVDMDTGDVVVSRVVVGQDTGLVINPAGVQHQIHGNVIQSISRTIKEEVSFQSSISRTREWGAYPVLKFPEVPVIHVVMMPRPLEPPLGAGESASVPSAAAIANAIFDATGVRMREPPFTPERVRAALRGAADDDIESRRKLTAPETAGAADAAAADAGAADAAAAGAARLESLQKMGAAPKPARRSGWWQSLGAAAAGAVGMSLTLLLWRFSIPPMTSAAARIYSAETLARGAQLAALGDCGVCHTVPNGAPYAGGRRLDTPFGSVFTTNITPDLETGIGRWSFAAFERAMRQGIHRDGRHLYPAFPYTAFTRASDGDLQALYAYLMSLQPVDASSPPTRLPFPFNLRPLMSFWNALFLRAGEFKDDASRSAQWNRGAYLVEGLGHCAACHSPRNVLGAEAKGVRHLSGGSADGWDAPSLTQSSAAPIAWSEAELFAYLRTGTTRYHGAAAGPMQPVIANLASLPDSDIQAMAHYIASFNTQLPHGAEEEMARLWEARTLAREAFAHESGARLFEGACAACHDPRSGMLAGTRPSLALNSNLHSARPDNVLRAILDGLNVPQLGHLGAMPSFRESLDDGQVADLVDYLRARFAPDKPVWRESFETTVRFRSGARDAE